jgi:hypothetical protein
MGEQLCLKSRIIVTTQVHSSVVHGSTVEGRESSNISRNLGMGDS